MKRVLVTGAAGRLGRTLLAHFAEAGVPTVGLDRVRATGTPAERVHVGDVGDPALVREALDGVDAVVHLAAIPAPGLGTPEQVFGGNSLATFAVLDAAGQAGVERAVIASSQSIYGLAFSPQLLAPAYVPIDEHHPLQVADAYALSKQADEATAVMAARRYGMTVVALRYPMLGGPERLREIAAAWREDPTPGARPLWAYLDDRDAANAAWLSLTAPLYGYHMFQVAAPETLAALPTEELLDRFYPGVPRRKVFAGREVPFDVEPAARVLGHRAAHLCEPSS